MTTAIGFSPRSWQERVDLVFYYNTRHFHYLHLTANDGGRRVLNVLCTQDTGGTGIPADFDWFSCDAIP